MSAVRDAYSAAREKGQDRVTAGRRRDGVEDGGRERLARIVGRGEAREADAGNEKGDGTWGRNIRSRLRETLGRGMSVGTGTNGAQSGATAGGSAW